MSAFTVAMRTSRRSLGRHRGRNALIAALVALPVALLVGVAVNQASQQPTTAQLIAGELGRAQARVSQVTGTDQPVIQSPDIRKLSWTTANAEETTQPPPASAGLDKRVPGAADALPLTETQAHVTGDGADLFMTVIVGAAWDPLLEGRYEITEGRVPADAGEAMIGTLAATRLGLGIGDQLTVDGHRVTVVGELAQPHSRQETVFVPLGSVTPSAGEPTQWFLRDAPLTWEDIQQLNQHGIVGYSRDVVQNPPSEDPLGVGGSESNGAGALIAVAFGGGIIAILLAGSAFAVGLRRDQRVLGMLAVTGADRRHVVAISVATGAWLGLLGGLAGTAGGLGFVAATQAALRAAGGRTRLGIDPSIFWGFHVPWWQVVAAVVFAAAVGAASAAVPAVIASRRDAMAALRGASRPRPLSRRWLTIGLAAGLLGVAGLAWGRHGLAARIASPGSWRGGTGAVWPTVIAASTLLALAGLIALTPLVLAALARLASAAPLSARLAVRDASRQTVRTVSVVVAIAAPVLAVTMATSLTAQSAQVGAERYVGWSPVGTLRVDLFSRDADGLSVAGSDVSQSVITGEAPGSYFTLLNVIPDAGYDEGQPGEAATGLSVVVPQPNRCPIYNLLMGGVGGDEMSQAQVAADERCQRWIRQTEAAGAVGHVVVGGPKELETLLGYAPPANALATLDAGGAVLLTPAFLDDGEVTFGLWDQASGNWPDSSDAEPSSTLTVPAVLAAPSPSPLSPFGAVISPQTAKRLSVAPLPSVLIAANPAGFTTAQIDAVSAALYRQGNLSVIYSAGPEPDLNVQFMWLLVAALAIVTVTAAAVATGLARADARNDDATLVSVGAAPGITRLIAMWQGMLTVGLAAVGGVALGLAAAWAASVAQPSGAFVVPWVLLWVVVLALPVLIGVGALAFTRPARPAAYRLAA